MGDGGGSGGGRAEKPPPCTADTSPSHLHPSSRYHQLIAPSSRNPKQKKRGKSATKKTQKKRQNSSGLVILLHSTWGNCCCSPDARLVPLTSAAVARQGKDEGGEKKNTRTRRLRSGMSDDEDGDSPHCGTGSMSAGAAEETPPPSMRDQTWLLAPSIHGAPVSVRLCLRIRSPRHQW